MPPLSMPPPLNYSGTMTLTLTAIALETSNGHEAQSSQSFDVIVYPVADNVEIVAENIAVDHTAKAVLNLNVRMFDTNGMLPGENGPELIEMTFTSVPNGVLLEAPAGGSLASRMRPMRSRPGLVRQQRAAPM